MADVTKYCMSDEGLQLLDDADALAEALEDGKTFQQIVGFSDDVLADFYEVAARLLEEGRYEEAGNAFVFLTTVNPNLSELWLGLGMAHQFQKDYDNAMAAYEAAKEAEPWCRKVNPSRW